MHYVKTERWLVLLAAGLSFAAASIDDPNKKDQEKLQGAWEIVSIEREGERVGPVRPMKWTIKDNRITQNIVNVAGAVREFSFKLDPSTNPKVIDITFEDNPPLKGKTVEGIYELNGDELRICVNWAARDAPKQRPTSFETKSSSNFGMNVLRREKQ